MDSILRIIEKEHGKRKNQLLRKDSDAEKHFAKLLNQASIYYVREKCCYDKYGNWCYIDFYLPLYNIAIEIDGKEHKTQKRIRKDLKKENFLSTKRNITTIRYTNKDCMNMESIALTDIVKKAGKTITNPKEIEYKKKIREREVNDITSKYGTDVTTEFFLYDKDKDNIFKFKDLYLMKHTTGVDYKYLMSAYHKREDINASKMFIITKDRDELNTLIDRYYEYLWHESSKVKYIQ